MAHMAEIKNNIVQRVIVINNEVLHDENGAEQESIGIAFCKFLYGADTEWVQTSYNGSFRGKFAGASMTYNPTTDTFDDPTEA
jgi:hypothetical protein